MRGIGSFSTGKYGLFLKKKTCTYRKGFPTIVKDTCTAIRWLFIFEDSKPL